MKNKQLFQVKIILALVLLFLIGGLFFRLGALLSLSFLFLILMIVFSLVLFWDEKKNAPLKKFDERQLFLRNLSYKIGFFSSLAGIFFGQFFFEDLFGFALFLMSFEMSIVIGYQALTKSHFSFLLSRKKVIRSYLFDLIFGSVYLIFVLSGTLGKYQGFLKEGKVVLPPLVWLALMLILVGSCGLIGNVEKKAN